MQRSRKFFEGSAQGVHDPRKIERKAADARKKARD
jgi:hypothetical protein